MSKAATINQKRFEPVSTHGLCIVRAAVSLTAL